MKVTLARKDDAFLMEATSEQGHHVQTDASEDIGGGNQAIRPMQMVLAALGSCSSIDVIHLLKKQRQDLRDLKVEIEADRADTVPRVFTKIRVHYILFGTMDEKKAERACRLSMEKLCSVSKMLEKAAEVSWSYEIRP